MRARITNSTIHILLVIVIDEITSLSSDVVHKGTGTSMLAIRKMRIRNVHG